MNEEVLCLLLTPRGTECPLTWRMDDHVMCYHHLFSCFETACRGLLVMSCVSSTAAIIVSSRTLSRMPWQDVEQQMKGSGSQTPFVCHYTPTKS